MNQPVCVAGRLHVVALLHGNAVTACVVAFRNVQRSTHQGLPDGPPNAVAVTVSPVATDALSTVTLNSRGGTSMRCRSFITVPLTMTLNSIVPDTCAVYLQLPGAVDGTLEIVHPESDPPVSG